MARTFKPDEILFKLVPEVEDLDLEGHFDDAELEGKIRAELEDGNEWAWTYVSVSASWAGFTGSAGLGGCSYKDEADFRENSGYFKDLLREAVTELVGKIGEAGWPLECSLEDIAKAVTRGQGNDAAPIAIT